MSGAATKRETLRTFIAIDLPAPLLAALASTQEQLQSYLRGQQRDRTLRWSPAKNLHLTLRFLGETTPQQCGRVIELLQAAAAEAAPFHLNVDVSMRGLGGFPNLHRPRVLWSGLGGDLEMLARLQSRLEGVAQAVGFAPEEKAFSPHLTLARAAHETDGRALAQVGQAISQLTQGSSGMASEQITQNETLDFVVDQIVYYQSELGAGGSRYTPLARLPFTGV